MDKGLMIAVITLTLVLIFNAPSQFPSGGNLIASAQTPVTGLAHMVSQTVGAILTEIQTVPVAATNTPQSPDTGTLFLKIKDRPTHQTVAYINLTVSDLILHYERSISSTSPTNQFIYSIPAREINITSLADEEMLLGVQSVPAGNVTKLVFNISSAKAVRTDGSILPLKVVADGKFMINIPFTVYSDGTVTITVDIQPNEIKISNGVEPVLVPVIAAKAEMRQGTETVVQEEIDSIEQDNVSITFESPENTASASWRKTDLTILVDSQDSSSISATYKAVSEWSNAIRWFTNAQSDYSHLNNLTLNFFVRGVNDTSIQGTADITITFADRLTLPQILGITNITFANGPSISNVDIMVVTHGLTNMGLQNVITHELGHALGLGHSDKIGDLMYSRFDKNEETFKILCPSTLDLYGLASLYEWMETGTYNPYLAQHVNLPEDMAYQTGVCFE